ncbi:hypothetical protein MUB24_12510 [Lederbergia sp. NSJ-179]|uniref:hypothetical protein n=1 Tax=Lederbergia sp. NSJ-179 TaxID=2931402 RepID=UPI001FD47F8F|nr:hypothetical protein [Lederbergia sp. NSJ-179]MCJ7841703.1 hypothetical protein [Lederbergia sp. NSJ-179]
MDTKQAFLSLLIKVRSQLRLGLFLKRLQQFLFTSALSLLLLSLFARFFVIPYLFIYVLTVIAALLICFSISAWKSAPSLQAAANLYDIFSGENRATTALSFLQEDDKIYELQRKDALSHMKNVEQTVLKRKKQYVHPLLVCLIFMVGMFAILSLSFPNEKIEEAKKIEIERNIVKKTKKELRNEIEKLENAGARKELEKTPEALQDVKQANEALKELVKKREEIELKKIEAKETQENITELVEQLEAQQLEKLAQALQEGDAKGVKEELNQLKEKSSALNQEQRKLLSALSHQDDPLSDQAVEEIAQKFTELAGNHDQKGWEEAQNLLDKEIADLASTMESHQLKPSAEFANQKQDGTGAAPNTSKQPKKTGQSAQGREEGQSGEKGNKGPTQEGQGKKGTAGTGGMSNNGGQANSSSSGAGQGSGSRELAIPESIDGKKNMEIDSGKQTGKGQPAEKTEGNGPVLKGSVRPYEEVYQQYEEASRQSIDRIEMPEEIESIVKNYFSKIKPEKE